MSDFKKELGGAIDKIADLGGEVETRCANCDEIGREECEKCDRDFHQKAIEALIPIIEKGIVGEDKPHIAILYKKTPFTIREGRTVQDWIKYGYNQRGDEQRKILKDLGV